MKKMLKFIIVTSIAFSLSNIWLKRNAICTSCDSATRGLPVDQFTLAMLAFVGLLAIAGTYYLSCKIPMFQYINLGISGISASISFFLITFQINHIICWTCLITDILFCIIFFLLCLEASINHKEEEIKGGDLSG